MVDIFSREQFEATLPKGLWTYAGFVGGEHVYMIRPYANKELGILVRSSIGADGTSKAAGQDSIRAFIVDPVTLRPASNKAQKWTTRVPGWPTRLIALLRRLANQIRWSGPCACDPTSRMVPYFVTKEGPNKGRGFVTCNSPRCNEFHWTEDLAGNFLKPPTKNT